MDQIKQSRVIFHYTDDKGAKGIIESQSIWLTHYMHLNDTSELCIFREALAHWIKGMGVQSHTVDYAFKLLLTEVFGGPDKKPKMEGYVVSFCDDQGDRLSQWRAYGKGRGYAIGFDEAELEVLLGKECDSKKTVSLFAGDVSYGNSVTLPKDIITDLEKCVESLTYEKIEEELIKASGGPAWITHIREALNLFMQCLCKFKHEGFSEEKEIRIVSFVPTSGDTAIEEDSKQYSFKIKLRTVEDTLVPYTELFEGRYRLPIKQIIVGPSPDIEVRKRAMQILLETNGMNPDIVRISNIPYRGM